MKNFSYVKKAFAAGMLLLHRREEEERGRYKAVYGVEQYKEKYEKERRRERQMYLLLGFVFLIAFTMDVFHSIHSPLSVEYDNRGEIRSISRPTGNQGGKLLGMEIIAQSPKGRAAYNGEVLIEPRGSEKGDLHQDVVQDETENERLERKLSMVKHQLNEDRSKKKVSLPRDMDGDISLSWRLVHHSNMPLITMLVVMACFFIYQNQRKKVTRLEKDTKDAIMKELPGFLNKMVLLLNAGVVLQHAFERIVEGNQIMKKGNAGYFYEQLDLVHKRWKETKAPIHNQLMEFSKRSGVKEWMRTCTIISDNVGKGNQLADKLQRESQMLWFMRKKKSEEKGRLAETKMTLPLVMLLLVLVLIAVAPAMLNL